MIPKDLSKKIRRIQITTSRLVTDIFAGQYHSVFKGRGMEFDEVREYQMGDDVRSIDWNVTARTGMPHVKKFVEERELSVMLLVDVSSSCQFASVHEFKSKLAAEIAATLAFAAIRNNDKVGLIIFTDRIEKFMPPRKGLQNVLRVIREVLYFEPQNKATDVSKALEYLSKVMTRKSVTFLISDFFEPNSEFVSIRGDEELSLRMPRQRQIFSGLRKALAIANKRHDVIAVTLSDPREAELPNCGILTLEDAETGKMVMIDTTDKGIREKFERQAKERLKNRDRLFRSIGMDYIDIITDRPYADELVKFFLYRRLRKRQGR